LPPLSLHRLSALRDSVGYGTGSSVGQGTPEGTTIIKVFLNVSRDEQKERFQVRLDRPDKNWKFRAGDLDDRELWPEFMEAYTDAIEKTSADRAPWYVVPAALVRRARRPGTSCPPIASGRATCASPAFFATTSNQSTRSTPELKAASATSSSTDA
jgi:hypothetical protein